MAKKDLKRFFAPRSVAVIGASATEGPTGAGGYRKHACQRL